MPKKVTYCVEVPDTFETIRKRVERLWAEKKPEMNKTEFSLAIGQKSSAFATKFLSGERPLTDLISLLRIARILGTSVGYLIGETGPDESALGAILREAGKLPKKQQEFVLQMILGLQEAEHPSTGATGEAIAAVPPSKPRKRPR